MLGPQNTAAGTADSLAAPPPARPLFLDGAAGPVFGMYFRPRAEDYRGYDVLLLPPLADEMNKARRMAACQARALNAHGIGMFLLDLYGTGDSHGDFRDARWDIWQGDIIAALDWLTSHGCRRVGLIGLRMGALFIPALLHGPHPVERIVLWQPVIRGDTLLTQFLRLRTAAAMRGDGGGETAASLRGLLDRGQTVEIAGYELSPALAKVLDGARLADAYGAPCPPVAWLDLVPQGAPAPPLASQSFVTAWRKAGAEVVMTAVTAAPFWSGQQITVAPELIRRTAQEFAQGCIDDRDTGLLSMRG